MTRLHDDIDRLFQTFDGDPGQFKEFSRSNYAREAEQRWPLLHDVAPLLGAAAQPLSEERKALWKRVASLPAHAEKPLSASHASELADKLATLSPEAARAGYAGHVQTAPRSTPPVAGSAPAPATKTVAPFPARKAVAARAATVAPAQDSAGSAATSAPTDLTPAALARLGRQVIFDPVASKMPLVPKLSVAQPTLATTRCEAAPVRPMAPAAAAPLPVAAPTGLFSRLRAAGALPLHQAAPQNQALRAPSMPLHASTASVAPATPARSLIFADAASSKRSSLGSLLQRISRPPAAEPVPASGRLFASAAAPAVSGRFVR